MANKLPNILFFGIDSLRSDHMSAYGYHRLTTPYIDRFAQGATLFEHHYSPHIPTTSGYTNMLTGMDVFSTQVVALAHKGPLRPEVRTLPEILRDAGYTSTCIGFTHNAASRGFDKYLDFDAGWKTWDQGRMPKAQNLNEVAVPELERLAQGEQPFLLFLRHMDPHSPYLPPAPYERMFYHGNETDPNNHSLDKVMAFEPFRDYIASWLPPGCTYADYVIAQYDGEVAYMDAAIQTLFTTVERLGIADDTIIVITSDHGETLNDHDCYFDHHGLYDPTLVVPLIIRWPGKIPAGRRIKGITRQYDTTPTLLDLIGIQPEGVQFDGRSLLPMIDGTVASQNRVHVDAQARLADARMEAHRCAGARLPLQAAGRAVQSARGPDRVQQPRGQRAGGRGASPRPHGGVDRAAQGRDRAAQPDRHAGRVARRHEGPVQQLGRGVSLDAHR